MLTEASGFAKVKQNNRINMKLWLLTNQLFKKHIYSYLLSSFYPFLKFIFIPAT